MNNDIEGLVFTNVTNIDYYKIVEQYIRGLGN